MKKVAVGVAFALAVVTSNAVADGIDRRYPPTIAAPQPYIAPPTWTGLYIGAGFGAGAVVHDISVRDNIGSLLSFDGIGGEGVFGTAIVGVDWQVSAYSVLGLFVDYDFSDISTNASAFGGDISAGVDHDYSWSVGARLGLLSSPSTLWYVTGGYTEARFESFARVVDLGSASEGRTFSGYFVGGGVDARLAASNWFLRLEYRYSGLDSEPIFESNLVDSSVRADVEPSMHTARLTLTYKFNSGWGANGWYGAGQ